MIGAPHMICIKDLSKWYGNHTALQAINLSINKGETVGLLGPNGAGKTTLIEILAGFLAPTSGQISIEGLDFWEHPLQIKSLIGYLPNPAVLYEDMTIIEYLRFIADLKKPHLIKKERQTAISKVIFLCALQKENLRLIKNLSQGFKQRVALAGTLLYDPDILLLDEPTDGLDPEQIREMRKIIQNHLTNKTVLISSHILSEISQICNRVLILQQGKLINSIKLSHSQTSYSELENFYMESTRNNKPTRMDQCPPF